MKLCPRCGWILPIKHFQYNRFGTAMFCVSCNARMGLRERILAVKHAKKQLVDAMKAERGCDLCPERDPICLHWHHRDPVDKKFNVSQMYEAYSMKRILAEIAKCDLLCANCHAKVERDLRQAGR